MTHETKMKVKRDYYAGVKAKAATYLVAMGAQPKEGVEVDSWEGMMSMVEYIKSHHPTVAEETSAEGAWARWNAADVECGKYKALMAAEEMVAREVEAMKDGEGKPVTEAAPATPAAEAVVK